MRAEEIDPPEYLPHPKAMVMPDLPEPKYQALKAGIADHGLQYPIKVLKGTRFLLDGRSRQRACRELGIAVKVDEIDIPDDDVAVYTGAEAAKRDGLTATQRVMFAMDLLPEFERRAAERQHLGATVHQGEKGKAAELAASLVGVSARYVQLGIQLRNEHPELFERVQRGEVDLVTAKRETKGKVPKPGRPRSGDDDGFGVPGYLRERLGAVTDMVGGDVLGDGIEALLDYIEGEGSAGWRVWADVRRRDAGR